MESSKKLPHPAEPALDGSEVTPDWLDFQAAIHALIENGCCGQGWGWSDSVRAALRPPSTPFSRLGRAAWEATISRRPPRLPELSGRLLLPSVTVAQPGQAPRIRQDVLIDEGRIVAIRATGAGGSEGYHVVEALRGQVVTPGLTDLHSHMPPDNVLKLTPLFMLLNLRHGLVRLRDAGDVDGTSTPAALAMTLGGELPGPELHYAYAFVGAGRARWGNTLNVANPGDAENVVSRLEHVGARWVKCYEGLDAASIQALVKAATARGMGVMGHVPTSMRVEEARLPDAQHYFGVPEPASLRRDHILNRNIDWHSVTPERIATVVAACERHGLAMTPTLATTLGVLRLEHPREAMESADVGLMPRAFTEIVWHPKHGLPPYRGMTPDDFARARQALERKLALTAALAKAGVILRLGTDTQQPFVAPGTALHTEIEAFEDAGIARESAWAAGSEGAAVTLGVPDSGRLEAGWLADLVVSPANPLAGGWKPASISAVMTGGALVMSADMDAAISAELARFEGVFGDYITRWLIRFSLDRVARQFQS